MRIERAYVDLNTRLTPTQADPLECSYEVVKAQSHMLEFVFPDGANTFIPERRSTPLPTGGRYIVHHGVLTQLVPCETSDPGHVADGMKHKSVLPFDLSMPPPPVWVDTSDQGASCFASHLVWVLDYGCRRHWMPGWDHRSHNVTENMFEQCSMQAHRKSCSGYQARSCEDRSLKKGRTGNGARCDTRHGSF